MPARSRFPSRLAAILAAALLLPSCSDRPAPPDGAKNVIVLTLDGLRQSHLSAFGYPRLTSPNLDWLAEHGLSFRTIIPTSCSTKASLTSLYTSLDYSDHQIIEHQDELPDDRLTLAEVFQEAGWYTEGFVASSHLMKDLNYDQGFEVYHDYASDPEDYVTADRVVGSVLRSLAERSQSDGRPFFYYIHIEEPHPPWTEGSPWLPKGSPIERPFDKGCTFIPSAEQFSALSERERDEIVALYDGAIHYADVWIGALLSALRARDLLQNTVIGVSTDHGYELLDRYAVTHGMNPYDEVTRTFLILFDGTERPAPTPLTDRQGRILDIGPTVLRRAGIEIPDAFRGIDLLGDEDPPPFAFTECYLGRVVRGEGYKLIQFDFSHERWSRKTKNRPPGIREGFVLYDLRDDPGELVDVSGDRPAQLERMRVVLDEHAKRLPGGGAVGERGDLEGLDSGAARRLRLLGYAE